VTAAFMRLQVHVVYPWLNVSVWGVFHMFLFNGASVLALASHLRGSSLPSVCDGRVSRCLTVVF